MNDLLITQLKAKKQQNADESAFLDSLITLAEQGWQTNQVELDNKVQIVKDSVATEIATLTSDKASLEDQLTVEKQINKDLTVKTEDLTVATQTANDALTEVVMTISDALKKVTPASVVEKPINELTGEPIV